MGKEYPSVTLLHHYPDAFGRLLLIKPGDFDVVTVDHMYLAGVFNDQCGAIVGSLGMIPSADLRMNASGNASGCFGFYEPAHGSVPHRAGSTRWPRCSRQPCCCATPSGRRRLPRPWNAPSTP